MELLDGGALTAVVQERPLQEPQIATISREVLQGLQFMHSRVMSDACVSTSINL